MISSSSSTIRLIYNVYKSHTVYRKRMRKKDSKTVNIITILTKPPLECHCFRDPTGCITRNFRLPNFYMYQAYQRHIHISRDKLVTIKHQPTILLYVR